MSKNGSKESNDKIKRISCHFYLGLNLWQLNEENRLVNKALNLDWKYGDRNWDFDRHFSVVFVVDTINVLEIIWPDMKKKVREGAEVDMQLLKEETEEESEKFQKWEREPESYISRNIQYKKKRRKEWMKIRSLWSNMPGQEKYLEVSHCGKLLTVQGELITKKCCKHLAHMISTKNILNTDFFSKKTCC